MGRGRGTGKSQHHPGHLGTSNPVPRAARGRWRDGSQGPSWQPRWDAGTEHPVHTRHVSKRLGRWRLQCQEMRLPSSLRCPHTVSTGALQGVVSCTLPGAAPGLRELVPGTPSSCLPSKPGVQCFPASTEAGRKTHRSLGVPGPTQASPASSAAQGKEPGCDRECKNHDGVFRTAETPPPPADKGRPPHPHPHCLDTQPMCA